jgi:hypothetical protein
MRTEIRAGLGRSGCAALVPAFAGSETTVSKKLARARLPFPSGLPADEGALGGVPSPALLLCDNYEAVISAQRASDSRQFVARHEQKSSGLPLRLLVDARRERDHLSAGTPSALAGDLEHRSCPRGTDRRPTLCKPLQLWIVHDEPSSSLTKRRRTVG